LGVLMTRTPCARAIRAVASVDPSLMTMIS
jgi:hypothetical protein